MTDQQAKIARVSQLQARLWAKEKQALAGSQRRLKPPQNVNEQGHQGGE
jgi:hypothetical protein